MQVEEDSLWRMGWLALDAKCRAHERQQWKRWEHTRFLVAAWTGASVEKVLPLPQLASEAPLPVAPPTPDFMEEMRRKAEALLNESK